MKLSGNVTSGLGESVYWLKKFESYYEKKAGFKLYPGSLNIKLKGEFFLTNPIRLEIEESGMEVLVMLQPCKIFDRKAFILRAEPDIDNKILEIVTDVKLRDLYNLKDGDEVEVEV